MSNPGSSADELRQYANQVLERCASTNDLARRLGEAGYPHGTWVSARMQEQGRGRLGRSWVSLSGNLFVSLLARIAQPELLTWVPLASALALTRAIQRVLPAASLEIKWPNDVWLDGKKLAGILCEAAGTRNGAFIVIGIGVNCGELPKELDQPAATLKSVLTADRLRPLLVSELTSILEILQDPQQGVETIRQAYAELALFRPGTSVEWIQASDPAKRMRSARVLGLGSAGELRVITEEAEELSLWAEDVRVRKNQDGS